MDRLILDGEYYIRIETTDCVEYIIFNEDYDKAVAYCKKNNIDLKRIKKYIDFK
jgi:hypothetical protein